MKIEIAESLIYSYLKHSEGCRVVQTNWTTSGNWIVTEFETERARELFTKVASTEVFGGIFKNNSFDQLIKQAEIDVLGINTTEQTVYGIDVAFHALGLNYGSKEETALRVIKKIFRTIFIMESYFSENEKFKSLFVTPKVNHATKVVLDRYIEQAVEIIDNENITIDFISNEEFYSQIVDPLLLNIKDEHDSNELFSRAIKLINLNKHNIKPLEKSATVLNTTITDKKIVNGMKIGQFARNHFKRAYENGFISNEEINMLQNPDYSKRMFNANFEILRKNTRSIKDDNGRVRYYSKDFYCGGYYLTSQWYETQWDLLLKWFRSIGYNYKD
jgi:hypothetical protein